MCLKSQTSGHKLVMMCRKAKNAERKGVARNFYATPWEIFATPWRCLCHPMEEILLVIHFLLNIVYTVIAQNVQCTL